MEEKLDLIKICYMTIKQLREYADSQGIEIPKSKRKRADIRQVIFDAEGRYPTPEMLEEADRLFMQNGVSGELVKSTETTEETTEPEQEQAEPEQEFEPEQSQEKPKDEILYYVKVKVNGLNVRKGPGVDTDVVKTLIKDRSLFGIVEEKIGPNTDGTETLWGKLVFGAGWIALKHTNKA